MKTFQIERIGGIKTYNGVDTYFLMTTNEPFSLAEAELYIANELQLSHSITTVYQPHAFKCVAIVHHVSN